MTWHANQNISVNVLEIPLTLAADCKALLDKLYLDSPSEYFPVMAYLDKFSSTRNIVVFFIFSFYAGRGENT